MLALWNGSSVSTGATGRDTLKFEPVVEQRDTLQFEPLPTISDVAETVALVVLLLFGLNLGITLLVATFGTSTTVVEGSRPGLHPNAAQRSAGAGHMLVTTPLSTTQPEVTALPLVTPLPSHLSTSTSVASGLGQDVTLARPSVPMPGAGENVVEHRAKATPSAAEQPQMDKGTVVPSVPPASTVRGIIRASIGANIRHGPGHTYAVIGGLSDGTPVTISNHMNDWFECVSESGEHGWIAAELIEIQSGTVATLPSRTVLLPIP